ncbi:hypothetical protein DB354_09630 [Opitutus sp. ER46]|nr:hypothetical protein DB354_09630 [Opitutus sp. ER46]
MRREKLRNLPVTVYPDFYVGESPFVKQLNDLTRPGDAVVVSHLDALKGSFRVADVGLKQADVWVHVANDTLISERQRNLAGAKAVVFVPGRYHDGVRREAQMMREDTQHLGIPLVVGLEYPDTRVLAHVGEIARYGDVITVYARSELSSGRVAFREYVERVVRAAKEANPNIKVEVAVAAARTREATLAVYGALLDSADLADRVAIYCNDTPEAATSLAELMHALRDPAAPTA